MIRGYSDHAANERTFLAWLRTSIAVIAFGFVVEKFNLFALTLLDTSSLDEAHRMRLERLSGSLPQGAGRAFIAVGVITIVLARSVSCAPGGCLTTRRCTRRAFSPI
jgi:putative membrane protein